MPTVADELAALRAKGSVKARATNLESCGGGILSTPEAEDAALRAKREIDKLGNIKAKEILTRGSQGAAEASAARAAELAAMRKVDIERKAEASEILKKGGSGYSREVEHTLNQTGKKKAEWEKKNEAKKLLSAPAKGKGPEEITIGDAKLESTSASDPIEKMGRATSSAAPVETKDDDDDVPKLEEVDEDDAIPELETPKPTKATTTDRGDAEDEDDDDEVAEAGGGRQITNRHEKKTRKMMTRLGMRPVPGIARVTLKTGGGRGYFFIERPDVFVGGGGGGGKVDTYVIFGEARQGGGGDGGGGGAAQAAASARAQAAIAAANANASSGGTGMTMPMGAVDDYDDGVPTLAADDITADEDGVDAKDVDLVMSQASCTRAKAVAALRENDGDLVNAIMSLTN
ncbi:hypothetical protein ACHAW5_008593 [Stephanodiscus triporus]|uniref:NAC-A/B domain-containing protein n=1 Tax=Stephanodiscus triporus TaxID=2934178 RepID=A0ABD3NP77_9STRA